MLARQLLSSSILLASLSRNAEGFTARIGLARLKNHASRNVRIFSSNSADTDTSSTSVQVLSQIAVTPNNGSLLRIRHSSESTKTDMTFGLFLPGSHKKLLRAKGQTLPALYWLSGLTCDDTNFSLKAGAFAAADREGIALVIPDTSPRGDGVPDADSYDLGQGAGFYVDATEAPWKDNYKMESYITKELPSLILEKYGVGDVNGVFGHSMGGK